MALKALMLRRNIEAKAAELEALQAKDADFAATEAKINAAIEEVTPETPAEARAAVESAIDHYDAELENHKAAKAAASAELEQMKAELQALEASKPAAPIRADKNTKGMNTAMHDKYEVQCNIRALPKSQRAFEAAFTRQERKEIVAQDDVQKFFAQLRDVAKVRASVTGADLAVPLIFLDLISENMYRYSKLINRVRVRDLKGKGRQTVAGVIPEAVWIEMCAALNELNFDFRAVEVDGFKVGGFVPVCNSLLEDTDDTLGLASWIVEMMSESIGLAVDAAILYGTGRKMPRGIVSRLAETSQPADYPPDAPAWVDLHTSNIKSLSASLSGAEFWSALTLATGNTFTKYSRGEQFWCMNSKTYNLLKSKVITFTATGDIVANVFGFLPIINGNIDILEFMPDNDIVGGYGDLYLLTRREGTTIGADETGRVNRIKDETIFFGKARADGKPIIPGAFVAINIAGSSVTTTHSFPGDTMNNANLASLSIGETLSPTFDADVTSYTATASNASDAVTALADDPDAQVVVEYNGAQIINGSTVTWATGTKNLVVTVKKGNATKVYTVAVTKN